MTAPTTNRPDLAILGLGYVGLTLAVEAVRAGLEVAGYDPDQEVVTAVRAGRATGCGIHAEDVGRLHRDGFVATSQVAAVPTADTYAICVPTGVAPDGTPDLSAVEQAATVIAERLQPGRLVVVESTVPPGTTDTAVAPVLEHGSNLTAGRDFYLACSSERLDPGSRNYGLRNTPKVLGGYTPACAQAGATFYGRLCDRVVLARSSREAEFAKLLENTYRAVNIALINELAMLASRIGVDLDDATACAATKPFGFKPFRPGPGVGGRCLPTAAQYLAAAARSAGQPLRLVDTAALINDSMPNRVVDGAAMLLAARGQSLAGATVVLLGVSYKPDVGDARGSTAEQVARLLRRAGATVLYHDPHVGRWTVDGNPVPRLPEPFGTPASLRADLTIRIQAHTAYRAPAAPRRTMVDAVDLAALGSASHEQADSPPVGMLNAMVAGYRAHERRVGPEPHPIDHGQREARDAR